LEQERSIKIGFKRCISYLVNNFDATVNLILNFSGISSVLILTNKGIIDSNTNSDDHKKMSDESIVLMPKKGPGVLVTQKEEFRRSHCFCTLKIHKILV
jgi:hypothetical protein